MTTHRTLRMPPIKQWILRIFYSSSLVARSDYAGQCLEILDGKVGRYLI